MSSYNMTRATSCSECTIGTKRIRRTCTHKRNWYHGIYCCQGREPKTDGVFFQFSKTQTHFFGQVLGSQNGNRNRETHSFFVPVTYFIRDPYTCIAYVSRRKPRHVWTAPGRHKCMYSRTSCSTTTDYFSN